MECDSSQHDAQGTTLLARTYFSVGGGFVVGDQAAAADHAAPAALDPAVPLSDRRRSAPARGESQLSISEMTLRNETTPAARSRHACRTPPRVASHAGLCRTGLPDRRHPSWRAEDRAAAPKLFRELSANPEAATRDPLTTLDWVSLWAIAVNEENAAGGRVVTAPTNGAAGIIPAVLHYFVHVQGGTDDDRIVRFLLTAGAIGILYKLNASISGAEVGCQGEVGVACSMAAGALCEALGGTVPQVENAAEIGMEHNLGLTCDPIGGLVQVPCIERNAMGAVKAINAARLALRGDGTHSVSLDKVIRTMRQTGADMSTKYKETSRGGLAVNMIEC